MAYSKFGFQSNISPTLYTSVVVCNSMTTHCIWIYYILLANEILIVVCYLNANERGAIIIIYINILQWSCNNILFFNTNITNVTLMSLYQQFSNCGTRVPPVIYVEDYMVVRWSSCPRKVYTLINIFTNVCNWPIIIILSLV